MAEHEHETTLMEVCLVCGFAKPPIEIPGARFDVNLLTEAEQDNLSHVIEHLDVFDEPCEISKTMAVVTLLRALGLQIITEDDAPH